MTTKSRTFERLWPKASDAGIDLSPHLRLCEQSATPDFGAHLVMSEGADSGRWFGTAYDEPNPPTTTLRWGIAQEDFGGTDGRLKIECSCSVD